jgi:hypothetical protein
MKKLLYHGTSIDNAISILNIGFDFSKCGLTWCSTYGKGLYFTPNYNTTKFYAGENGIVLSFVLKIIPYYLKKDISPNSKKKFKLPLGYNSIINPNQDEYVIFYFIK